MTNETVQEAVLAAGAAWVRNAPLGKRHYILGQCAFSLGALGAAGFVEGSAAWRTLCEAALAAGVAESTARAIFLVEWRRGREPV